MNKNICAVCIGMLTLSAAVMGSAKVVVKPIVPETLDVPPNQEVTLQARAAGFQIYACGPRSDASGFAWTLKAPEADLFDSEGRKIGSHYAGPTWEAVDGSKVGGTVKARADAPDASAIPWLLLGATSNTGTGVFARVANIQRLNTAGGNAPPAQTCDQSHVGTESRVPYTATYYFYSAR
jgi:uncharacterized protein DUF3455